MSEVERVWVVGRVERVIGSQPRMTLVTVDGLRLRGLVPAALREDVATLPGRWVEFRAGVGSGRWHHPTEARLTKRPVQGGGAW